MPARTALPPNAPCSAVSLRYLSILYTLHYVSLCHLLELNDDDDDLTASSYLLQVHTRISHCNGRFMFANHRRGSARTVEELIGHGICVRGQHRQLLYPVSRLMRMRSLKEYCRFALRRLIAIDRIDALEIPVTLKAYLKENPY